MAVTHVYKTNYRYSSRVLSQLSIDNGTVEDRISYFDVRLIISIARKKKQTVIFHQHAMLFNLLCCYLICSLLKSKNVICFDCHDINEWHDDYSLIRKLAWLLFELMEKITFSLNVPVMCVSRCFARILYNKYGKSVLFVPNIPSLDLGKIERIKREAVRSNDRMNLIYFGHINQSRLSIATIKKLIEKHNLDIYGKFAGHSDEYHNMLNSLEEKGLLKICGEYRPEDISSIVSRYDASLMTFEVNKLNIRYCMPNKLYQSLSCGVPCIISPGLVEVSLAFKKSSCINTMNSFLSNPNSIVIDDKCGQIVKRTQNRFRDNYMKLLSS